MSTHLCVLDYGCGGGLFCRKMHELGFDVTGYDQSEELIKIARDNVPAVVTITDSHTIVEQKGKYDVISAIMVFQFINDIESTIENILPLLKANGMIIYAVFNPHFIKDNVDNNIFSGFTNIRTGYMELAKGVKIPVFNRSESEYRCLFGKYGYQEVYLDYPVFTEEFLGKFNMPFSTSNPEYLIQAFRIVT